MASEMIDPMGTSPYSPTGLPGGATSSAGGGAWRDPGNWVMPLMMLSAATSGLGKKKGGSGMESMMMPMMLMQMMQGKKPDQSAAAAAPQTPAFNPIYLQQPAAPSSGGMDPMVMAMLLGRGQPPAARPAVPIPMARPQAAPLQTGAQQYQQGYDRMTNPFGL